MPRQHGILRCETIPYTTRTQSPTRTPHCAGRLARARQGWQPEAPRVVAARWTAPRPRRLQGVAKAVRWGIVWRSCGPMTCFSCFVFSCFGLRQWAVFSCFRVLDTGKRLLRQLPLCFCVLLAPQAVYSAPQAMERILPRKPLSFRKLHRRSGDVHDICMCMCMCMYTYTEPNQIRF